MPSGSRYDLCHSSCYLARIEMQLVLNPNSSSNWQLLDKFFDYSKRFIITRDELQSLENSVHIFCPSTASYQWFGQEISRYTQSYARRTRKHLKKSNWSWHRRSKKWRSKIIFQRTHQKKRKEVKCSHLIHLYFNNTKNISINSVWSKHV